MPRHPSELGPYLEVTNLDPNATHVEIRAMVADAIRYQVAAVCVYPYWLRLVVDMLAPYDIPAVTVVSYPHGLDTLDCKLEQIDMAEEEGAKEVNVILNPHYVNAREWHRLEAEARSLMLHNSGVLVKAAVNASRLPSTGIQSAALHVSRVDLSFLALYSESDHPTRDDVVAAHSILYGTSTELLVMGNYTHNLAALRAVQAGARRISTQFPVRLIGPP